MNLSSSKLDISYEVSLSVFLYSAFDLDDAKVYLNSNNLFN